jgi:P27 family predicted phage terminase small subunit
VWYGSNQCFPFVHTNIKKKNRGLKMKKTDRQIENENKIIQFLNDKEVFNEVDKALISIYANELECFLDTDEMLKKEGYYLTSSNGIRYINPYYKIRNQSFKNVNSCAKALGLNPLSRKALNISSNIGGDDILDELIRG